MPFHETDDGCRLAYAVAGRRDAPAMVLSNSLGTSRTMWDWQMDRLADRFRVLRYDTRGHGESDAPDGAYTIDRLGRDALALMDAAGIARAHVCGVSLGGMTALWLGVHAPERVNQLVLANTGARIGSNGMWNERIHGVATQGLESLADSVMARWFTAGFRAAEPQTVERLRAALCRTPVAGYVGCCTALRDADLRDAAADVRAPCLVVTGSHDVATPPALGTWLVEHISGAAIVTLDAAHLSNIECAPQFNDAVTHFLSA